MFAIIRARMCRSTLVFSLFASLVAADGQIQSSTTGCKAPQVSAHRTFTTYDSNDQPVKGERVPNGGYIDLKCANGYLFPDGSNTSTSNCRPTPRGEWHPAPEPCQRICRLPESSTVHFTCKYNGREIDCDDTPLFNGTEIRPECKERYRPSGNFVANNTTIRCTNNGTWDKKIPKCEPGCGVVKPDPFHENVSGHCPWHVAIYSIPRGYQLICSGTLIAPNVVLSAARCFYDEKYEHPMKTPADYALIVGKLTKNYTTIDDAAQKQLPVSEILFSEQDYKPVGYIPDVALIILKQRITISADVLPACFRTYERAGFNPGSSVYGTLCDWGLNNSSQPTDTLKSLKLSFVHYNRCASRIQRLPADKFCAGSDRGPSARLGSIGGGLLFKDPKTNFLYVRGLVSAPSHGNESALVPFTDISYYQEWINKVIEEKSGRV